MSGLINRGKTRTTVTKERRLIQRSGSVENISRRHTADTTANKNGNGGVVTNGVKPAVKDIESQYIRNLQQQIYYLELENGYLKHQLKRGKELPPKLIGEADQLMDKLRKSHFEREQAVGHLHEKDSEIEKMEHEKDMYRQRLKAAEETYSKDKQALTMELIDFRKKLDDIAPEVTRKEAEVSQLQNELHQAISKFNNAQHSIEMLQLQVAQFKKEEVILHEIDGERKTEIDQMIHNVKKIEDQTSEEKSKLKTLQEELNVIKKQLREKELLIKHEKAINERISEENQGIISENAELASKIDTLETDVEQMHLSIQENRQYEHIYSKCLNATEQERSVRQELMRTQESLSHEQQKTKQLNARLADIDALQTTVEEAQDRLQKEIDGLEKFSRELSGQNKTLREEKLKLEDKLNEMQRMMTNKDYEIDGLQDRISNTELRYRDFMRQYENEAAAQEQKSKEFEKLAKQVRELARNTRPGGVPQTPDTPYSES